MLEMPDFMKDDTTRSILSWIGGGVVTIVGAIWAVYKFRSTKKRQHLPSVSASNRSIAVGRDIRDTKIEMKSGRER